MKYAILLFCVMSMPVKADTSVDLTFYGFSNHFTSTVEIAPGQYIQPALNEFNLGFGIGISHRGDFGEVWGEASAYHNSFERNSRAMMLGAGIRAGEYFLGLAVGLASGYEQDPPDRTRPIPEDRPPVEEVDYQEFGGLCVRTGASTFIIHPNLTLLTYRYARFDISDALK